MEIHDEVIPIHEEPCPRAPRGDLKTILHARGLKDDFCMRGDLKTILHARGLKELSERFGSPPIIQKKPSTRASS